MAIVSDTVGKLQGQLAKTLERIIIAVFMV